LSTANQIVFFLQKKISAIEYECVALDKCFSLIRRKTKRIKRMIVSLFFLL